MEFVIDNFNAMRSAIARMSHDFLEENVSDDDVFRCKLVASELVSNVLQHGGKRAYFRVTLENGRAVLLVKGENGFRPPEKSACAAVNEECGRGLFLIDAYCEERGYTEADGIRVVIRVGS